MLFYCELAEPRLMASQEEVTASGLCSDGALQVEEEMEDLREMCRRRLGEEETEEDGQSKVETCCQEALQRVLGAQELGNNCLRTVTMVTSVLGISSIFIRLDQVT